MSGGNISISNSTANWNQNGVGGGIIAITEKASTPKTVLISNVETSGNDWIGIWIRSSGAITLTNVNASDNGFDGGINLENALCTWDEFTGDLIECLGSGSVNMTNIEVYNNQGTGLQVYSRGLITLAGAWASNNWGSGIRLANDTASLAGVTMSNVNTNDNNGTGLEAYSNGLISLRGAEANNNKWDGGINLQNNFEGAVAGITILNASAYNNNSTGISAQTNGALLMTSLAASGNAKGRGSISGTAEPCRIFTTKAAVLTTGFLILMRTPNTPSSCGRTVLIRSTALPLSPLSILLG